MLRTRLLSVLLAALTAVACESSGDRSADDPSSKGVTVSYGDQSQGSPAPAEGPAETSNRAAPAAPPGSAAQVGLDEPLAPQGIVQRGEFRGKKAVVDGDTVRVVGFGKSVRLLNVNSEEKLQNRDHAELQKKGWQVYVDEHTSDDPMASFGTPMGEEARRWAREFFADVDQVWVEYESPVRTHGFFGRHLGYVWVKRDGGWINYNIEAVRAGMSPYYTKYGYSAFYHAHFEAAEAAARRARRGIWAPQAKSYPNYAARKRWWNARADQIATFRQRFDGRDGIVELAEDTAFATLRHKLGKRVVVFGAPSSFKERGDPQRVRLTYRYRRDFPVVAFAPVDMRRADADPDAAEFLYVEGTVELYRGDPQLRFDEASWMRPGERPPAEEMLP